MKTEFYINAYAAKFAREEKTDPTNWIIGRQRRDGKVPLIPVGQAKPKRGKIQCH